MDSKRKPLVIYQNLRTEIAMLKFLGFGLLIKLKYSFWKKITLIKETTSCLSEKGKEAT